MISYYMSRFFYWLYDLFIDRPLEWIMLKWYVIYYTKIVPIWTGKPAPLGYDPDIISGVYNQKLTYWNPKGSFTIPYHEFCRYGSFSPESRLDLYLKTGYRVTPFKYIKGRQKFVYLKKLTYPQYIPAHPITYKIMSDSTMKAYYERIALKRILLRESLELNPLNKNVVTYSKTIRFKEWDIISWNIQMDIRIFGQPGYDMIEFLFNIIGLLILLLVYFIGYELTKLFFKLKEADNYIKKKFNVSIIKPREELTAKEMNNLWREGRFTSKFFDFGIIMERTIYNGSLVLFELLVIMILGWIYVKLNAFYNYINLVYNTNEELYTHITMYIFIFGYFFYKRKYKKEKIQHLIDYVTVRFVVSHLKYHTCLVLAAFHAYKLMNDLCPIHWFIIFYFMALAWVYFVTDSKDYFQGWDQAYRLDLLYREDHWWWWPRITMHRTWWHFIMTVCYPWHRRFVYLCAWIIVILWMIFGPIYKLQNKIHVYINNKFFFWNPRKYTFEEIQAQWKEDEKYNYILAIKKKNNRKGGLIIH